MLKAADEDDVGASIEIGNASFFERIDRRKDFEHQCLDIQSENRFLDRADDERQVGPPRQSKLLLLSNSDGRLASFVLA